MTESGQVWFSLRNVSRWFGDRPGVRNVDLTVKVGESIGLVGPNGSGKTTLLKLLSGELPPTAGELQRHSLRAGMTSPDGAIGFAGHELMLYEQLTCVENLQFYAGLYNRDGARDRIRQLLASMNLSSRRNAPVTELSSGMKKKLSICRALVHRPDVLLLDEPFRGVDATSTEQVLKRLKTFRDGGGTLLLSSHNLSNVQRLCDDVLLLVNCEPQSRVNLDDCSMEEFRRTYRNAAAGA